MINYLRQVQYRVIKGGVLLNSRAEQLISLLDLAPHPEGGHYRETFRAAERVHPGENRAGRTALTSIYFLLSGEEASRWHRVASTEIWHYHEGDPLELWTADPGCRRIERRILAPLDRGGEPVRVVKAGDWQAATLRGEYTLVSCVVGPGFEFEDFKFLRDLPAETAELKLRHPEAAWLI